jgi:hypothetical protein
MNDDTPDSAFAMTGGGEGKNFAQAADMLIAEQNVHIEAKKSLKSYEWWLYVSLFTHIMFIALILTVLVIARSLKLAHLILIVLSVPLLVASCLSYMLAIRGKKKMSDKSTITFIKIELVIALPLATLMLWFLIDYIKSDYGDANSGFFFVLGMVLIFVFVGKEIFLIRSAQRLLKYIHRISILQSDIQSIIGIV